MKAEKARDLWSILSLGALGNEPENTSLVEDNTLQTRNLVKASPIVV